MLFVKVGEANIVGQERFDLGNVVDLEWSEDLELSNSAFRAP